MILLCRLINNDIGIDFADFFAIFNSVCSVFHQYQHHSSRGIPLLSPIQFGNQTCYNTRTAPYFTNSVRCQLTFTQRFFWHKATNWWNSLPADLKELHSFRDFYMTLLRVIFYHLCNLVLCVSCACLLLPCFCICLFLYHSNKEERHCADC